MIVEKHLVENTIFADFNAVIPCEMADPVTYSPDGRSVETFRPCGAGAEWRLVLRWHHGPGSPDEHLLCDRHLGVWQVFRLVENPSWDIALLAKL